MRFYVKIWIQAAFEKSVMAALDLHSSHLCSWACPLQFVRDLPAAWYLSLTCGEVSLDTILHLILLVSLWALEFSLPVLDTWYRSLILPLKSFFFFFLNVNIAVKNCFMSCCLSFCRPMREISPKHWITLFPNSGNPRAFRKPEGIDLTPTHAF